MSRIDDIQHFYQILDKLESIGGLKRKLDECNIKMVWPERGIYFIFEENEIRTDSGDVPRVVRVGTHALKHKSKSTVWKRLSQHRGQVKSLHGNHRGSIFRLLVGNAIMNRDGINEPNSWGIGNDPNQAAMKTGRSRTEIIEDERNLESNVSNNIRNMRVLCMKISDEPGQDSMRGYIERNSIALLSNYKKDVFDPPSDTWLGTFSNRERVRLSGLWNNNHVDENYEEVFLDRLESLVNCNP